MNISDSIELEIRRFYDDYQNRDSLEWAELITTIIGIIDESDQLESHPTLETAGDIASDGNQVNK